MKTRILVVEDAPADYECLKDILEKENYELSWAPTGKKGLEMLAQEIPDMVILDIMLPDTDGFEICKYLRRDERFAGLPILFYTSRGDTDDKLLGLELGASDFLVKGSDSREMLVRIRNLLHYKRLFDEMIQLSVIDSLTHVYNRRYFQHRLVDEFERGRRYRREFCCVIIDVDNFKQVNDTYGHPAGDLVLKTVAACLRRNIRAADILCRYGGDEFGLLLPETESIGAYITAERMRRMIEAAEIGKPQYSLRVTLSCGISSLVEGKALGMDELVTQADVALYRAKRAGRNRTQVYGKQINAPPENNGVIAKGEYS